MRILTTALLLIIAAPVAAQDRGTLPPLGQPPSSTIMAEPVAVMLAGFDSDGDGRATRAECIAGIERSFRSIDTSGKGSLGYIDFSDWAERWLGDRNALPSPFETDTDNDNRITLSELQAKIMTIFDRLDRNKDGVLVRSELLTLDGARRFGGSGIEERSRKRRGGPLPQ